MLNYTTTASPNMSTSQETNKTIDDENINSIEFWISGVLSTALGSFGFIVNCIAIYIFISKRDMQIFFHHLLVISLSADNLYLCASGCLNIYFNFGGKFLVWILPHFAIPFKAIAYTMNIVMHLCLSQERYRVIRDPQLYHATMSVARNRCARLKKYIL